MIILYYYPSSLMNQVLFVKLRLFTKNKIKTPNRYGSKTRFFVTTLLSFPQKRFYLKDDLITMRTVILDDIAEVLPLLIFRRNLYFQKRSHILENRCCYTKRLQQGRQWKKMQWVSQQPFQKNWRRQIPTGEDFFNVGMFGLQETTVMRATTAWRAETKGQATEAARQGWQVS
ncbi:uncharacterized protein DS421_8g238710 [Arachis hypogaea]|nr:uncharacterized protein DS421_8g238710 [Arachis hypogaea]